jgi:predicted anti-sigma-YlaC factor YlaD
MTCAEARERILSADAADLAAGTASDLGDHLAVCDDCRGMAERVLAVENALRAERAVLPRRPAAEVAARAVAAGRRARARRRWIMWAAGPALAAALVVAVLLARHQPNANTVTPVAEAPTPPPLVDGSSGNVAVITTANPDIVVVWQF